MLAAPDCTPLWGQASWRPAKPSSASRASMAGRSEQRGLWPGAFSRTAPRARMATGSAARCGALLCTCATESDLRGGRFLAAALRTAGQDGSALHLRRGCSLQTLRRCTYRVSDLKSRGSLLRVFLQCKRRGFLGPGSPESAWAFASKEVLRTQARVGAAGARLLLRYLRRAARMVWIRGWLHSELPARRSRR